MRSAVGLRVTLCAGLAFSLPGCAITPDDPFESPWQGPGYSSSDLFRAAIEAVARPVVVRILVDPQPMNVRHGDLPTSADYLAVPAEEVRERSEIASELGFEVFDAFPVDSGCRSLLFVRPPARANTSCPDEFELVIVVGVPTHLEHEGMWIVPIVTLNRRPYGVSLSTLDLMLSEQDGGLVRIGLDERMTWN